MKKIILSIIFIVSLTILNAQNPGNIGATNLTAWFKPDALTVGNVTSWTTTFPTGGGATTVTDASSPYPLATNTPTGDVSNYNTTIEFTNNTLANLKALENTASLDFLDNLNATDQGTFFCAYLFPNPTSNDHLVLYNESSLDAIQLRNFGASNRIALGLNAGSTNGTRNWAEEFIPSVTSYKGNKSGVSTMNFYDRSLESIANSASGSSGPTGLYFGVKPGIGTSPLNGYLHEVIFYNTDLTPLEISKVHTYLAIKYGITLLNTGSGIQGDYHATNYDTIWDADVNANYHNNVIGIGRDDNQGLLQKQSHSYKDTTRIYLNTLVATNIANGGSFTNDISYVTVGGNQGKMCETTASNTEIPIIPNLISTGRLEREWKVTKTNFSDNFSFDFTLNTCASVNLNTNCLSFLVDDDGDFSNGGTTYYTNNDGTGIVISNSSGIISVNNISATHIPNNTTQYVTLISTYTQSIDMQIACDSYTWIDGNNYTASNNTATHTIPNGSTNGCDSIVTLNLTINNSANSTDVQSTCNPSYTWIDNIIYTSSNSTATHTFPNGAANGCDSIITLNLTINIPATSTDIQTACGSYTWIDGNNYTANNNSATHTIVNGAVNGCDSIVTLNLTINNTVTSIDVHVACESYTWIDGNNYTVDNNSATHTIVNGAVSGCDSIVTLNLTINNSINTIDAQSACVSYNWIDGLTYNSSNNTATHTIIGGAGSGCDSIITLNLTIYPNPVIDLGADTVFCEGSVLLTLGDNFVSYLWNDGSTSPSITVSTDGNYTVTVTDINGCSDYDFIEVAEECPFTLWAPNTFTPNGDGLNDVFTISGENLETIEVMIFNRWGQLLRSWNDINNFWDGTTSDGNKVPSGVYPYIIEYSYIDGETRIRDKKVGHINLLR